MGQKPGDIMCLAASHGFIQVIKFFESPQYPISYQNNFGDSLLHFAAKGSQPQVVNYLLLRGVKPTLINKFNETPLFSASESGNLNVTYRLCKEKEIKVDYQDKFGDTALHFAARDGHLDICEFLLRKSKRLAKIKNQEGKTAMNYALENGQTSCSNCIKNYDGEAAYADRETKIKELALKMMQEFPDYKKSLFKHQPSKITLFSSHKISRGEIEAEQRKGW